MAAHEKDEEPLLITIDGPAGAGKTTVSRMLAARLGYLYVDTGALYRGTAFEVISHGIEPDDHRALEKFLPDLDLMFQNSAAGARLLSKGIDITDKIRTPEITMLASRVSANPLVRDALLDVQRQMGARKAAVFEGRDMGTVVFPGADLKFFLTADPEARAMRRYREYSGSGQQSLDDVLKDMAIRDRNDSSRAVAPLRPADDAVIIDSTHLATDSVVGTMIEHVRRKLV